MLFFVLIRFVFIFAFWVCFFSVLFFSFRHGSYSTLANSELISYSVVTASCHVPLRFTDLRAERVITRNLHLFHRMPFDYAF